MCLPGEAAAAINRELAAELSRNLRNMANEPEIGLPKVCTHSLSAASIRPSIAMPKVIVNPDAKAFEMPEREIGLLTHCACAASLYSPGADGVKRRKIDWQIDRCPFSEEAFNDFYRFLRAQTQQNEGSARDGVKQCMRYR